MTREEFIDKLYSAMYQNRSAYRKKLTILDVIDEFILSYENKICKNCKFFQKNENGDSFCVNPTISMIGSDLLGKTSYYLRVDEFFGCNRFIQKV